MKTKIINLYTIEELEKENIKGYEKAIQYFRGNNDYMFLEDCMNEKLHELLEENKITDLNDTSKAGTKPTPVRYSLSYSQGEGAMFEGKFIFKHEGKEYTAKVKHSGYYYHSNSKDITIVDSEGEETDAEGYAWGDAEAYFNGLYIDICKELKTYGYDFIEYEDSEENIKGNCEANEYYFTIDGVLTNI
jgi:hypothetical protein